MKKKLTSSRFILAVISTALEMAVVWAVWQWLLPELGVQVEVWVLIIALFVWLLFSVFLYVSGSSALKTKEYAGLSSMVGMAGQAVDRLAPNGMVKIKGELWKAAAENGVIEVGDNITVTGEDRLKLVVRKIE
jgi:membrane-bound serine protease (ClpP class)